ncbi:MAG: cytochrome c [Gammaproteobacteria bacterium]|nr:cytochrome c [Gammaproteobacteria bacterium]MBT8123408.1 cytochrome c [Gammaproteobacteria bacterium]MDH3609682.1 cytochrome c [Gammaproteobacteria bacterium]
MHKLKHSLKVLVLISGLTLIQSIIQAEPTEEQLLGESIFINNCATCHGEGGKGNGPMAEQLIKVPSDLTLLSKSNGGSFPETEVYQLLDGRRVVVTDEGREAETFHGSKDMPIWGDTFRIIEGDDGAVDELISNLLEYLESIQVM